jgi:hypothetical protein
MKFSLIQIDEEINGLVSGVWLQDYTGEFDKAVKKAKATEKANGNRIKVAIIEKTNNYCPNYSLLTDLKRLG